MYPVGSTVKIIPGMATSVVRGMYSYRQAHTKTLLAQAPYTLNAWDKRGPEAPKRGGIPAE
ncbi:uncharacterized protein LACBIDRAFT_299421 [Laccaria bicolor S238N-H82]|uniref:Predicted protein n=2 Tax=Laccaria bicolor (strain S238N-H82 / ATCC MYA-4686) TaxID=486041 RepID=B0DEN3_LACBS|nr:uncharacterized protein LACBIDRAFT_299421 [Laccaria bicolor S238N-H82]EDR06968.1 predicted protein [Laccaria bicolor S238N-H82]|eukprot:XP_001882341.1 predicted protein [Laccaria bicolor S238N-H82]